MATLHEAVYGKPQIEPDQNSIKRFDTRLRQYIAKEELSSAQAYLDLWEPNGFLISWMNNRWFSRMEEDLNRWSALLGECESPIEQMLAMAFDVAGEAKFIESVEPGFDEEPQVSSWLTVESQIKIDAYRIDFRVTHGDHNPRPNCDFRKAQVLVECDGHDFHERTKEQAKRDKSRDRKLQSLGYSVLRFTGSEIWDDPFKCTNEVIQFLTNEVKK